MKKQMAKYLDDQGEMDGIGERIVDFLPRPEQLVPKEDKVKVTITLSDSSLQFFKRHAKKQKVPYQKMIRSLLDHYARLLSQMER